jgi:UDP-3-O-[3-hydroxymyristoyl] glucosamine N-acyltransferase
MAAGHGARLGELAVRHGCELRGDPDLRVDHVATLRNAGPGALAFLANPAYRQQLPATRATAVVLAAGMAADCPAACLVSGDPYAAYARMAADLYPPAPLCPGIAAGATLGAGCQVPASAAVAAGAVLGTGVRLGDRVFVGPHCVLGDGVVVGDDTRLVGHCTIYPGVVIGARGLIHAGVVIGADGFGFARERDGRYTKVPQVGGVRVGDDVEIGANTTIDRGALDDTIVGDGVKLDNQIQVGHNVVIGAHTVIAAQVGIAGSAVIGARCVIGGQAGIAGHLTIADDVVVAGGAAVTGSLRRAGFYGGGPTPADELPRWRRNMARFGQLDGLAKRLRALERRMPHSETDEGDGTG